MWLEAAAVERHGPETAHWIEVYRRFYGFYFADAHEFDPALRLVSAAAGPGLTGYAAPSGSPKAVPV